MESIFLIIVGLALAYFAIRVQFNANKLRKKGIKTDGIIFDTVQSDNPDSGVIYPLVRFVTSKNEWITEKYNVGTTYWLLKKGQKITVIYNPENPKEFIIKSAMNALVPIFLAVLSIAILARGIYGLLHI